MEFIDKLLFWFLIFLIALGVLAIYTIRQDGTKCLSNPLQFGIKAIEDRTTIETSCICSLHEGAYAPFLVTANSTMPIKS